MSKWILMSFDDIKDEEAVRNRITYAISELCRIAGWSHETIERHCGHDIDDAEYTDIVDTATPDGAKLLCSLAACDFGYVSACLSVFAVYKTRITVLMDMLGAAARLGPQDLAGVLSFMESIEEVNTVVNVTHRMALGMRTLTDYMTDGCRLSSERRLLVDEVTKRACGASSLMAVISHALTNDKPGELYLVRITTDLCDEASELHDEIV